MENNFTCIINRKKQLSQYPDTDLKTETQLNFSEIIIANALHKTFC